MTFEDKLENEGKKFNEKPGRMIAKWLGLLLVVVLALTLVSNALGIASIYWQAEKAKVTAAPRVTSKIYETENIIAKVALFHDKCTKVVADLNIFQNNYGRYVADKEAVADATGLAKESASESMSNDISDYTAALNVAQEDAEDYDSASAQYTQNPFKAQNLPYRINIPPGAEAAYKTHVNCN